MLLHKFVPRRSLLKEVYFDASGIRFLIELHAGNVKKSFTIPDPNAAGYMLHKFVT
jgi:hypothetical protein